MDISILNKENNVRLNIRVAGLIVNDNKVLLQTCDNVDFYSLPGGRVKYMEDTLCAIKRELKEEIGIDFLDSDIELLDMIENFFEFNNSKYHEFLFVYKISNCKEISRLDNFKTLDKSDSYNSWHSLDDIENIDIKPAVLKKVMKNDRLGHNIIHEI